MTTASVRRAHKGKMPLLLNGRRVFLALWYLGGSLIHFMRALHRPQIYVRFGQAPLYPLMGRFWAVFVMPHITTFALILAAFELVVVVLLLSKGRAVTFGLTVSLVFNLFLVQMGLGYSATLGSMRDFALNRLSNVVFILAQLPLYWVRYDRSIWGIVRARWSRRRRPA